MTGNGVSRILARMRAVYAPLRRAFDERFGERPPGQALVMVTIMIMVLIGFVALATDTGFIWMNRRSLQNAADAAALAGVQALPGDPATATSVGCDFATVKNSISGMTGKTGTCASKADVKIKTTYFTNDTITVKVYKTINPIFGIAVGFGSVEIGATATAIMGSVGAACPFPLFQTPGNLSDVIGPDGDILDPPALTKLKAGPSGDFLALEVNGSASKDAWKDVVGSPAGCDGVQYKVGINGDFLDVNPGTFEGPFKTAMQNREALWTAQGNCTGNDPTVYRHPDGTYWNNGIQLTPATCYRMIKVPLINADLSTIKPSDQFHPIAYAVFYLAAWCDKTTCPATAAFNHTMAKGELWGYYLHFAASGGTDYVGYNGYGTKVAVLVD